MIIETEAECRMCTEEYPTLPCPECGACFACAYDDCGTCCRRRDFMVEEAAYTERRVGAAAKEEA
jgi:hypothetical protein